MEKRDGERRAHQRPIVVIAEDNAVMRDLITTVFSMDGGWRIGGVACDGLEAALMTAEIEPDVIVLDFFMPRWDGARAAEFIRANSPHTAIVAFSGALRDKPSWADDFLTKTDIGKLVGVARALAA